MKRFEYKIMEGDAADDENRLNFMGANGWELVAIKPVRRWFKITYKWYFKKEDEDHG